MISTFKLWSLVSVITILTACTSPIGNNTRPVRDITLDPKAAELNVRLGINYMQRGDYEIALEKLEKALIQDPNLASAHNTIALLYQTLQQMDKAENHFKQAIIRRPSYSAAHNNYGVFLCQQGQFNEAEQQFLIAIKNPLYNSTAQAYENAGLCVRRISNNALAESYFRKALQLHPNLAKSLMNMAEIRFLEIDYESALSYIKRYQKVARWNPKALLIAIKIADRLNDQNAKASYALLLRAEFPDSDEALTVTRGQY